MGCSSSIPAEQVSKQLSKELKRVGSDDGLVRVAARYHKLPVRLSDHYTVTTKLLGHGQSGDVFLAISKLTGRQYAVKTLNMCALSSKQKNRLVSEISILLGVDHPNIATLTDAYESEAHIHLISECMEGGTLCELAKKQQFTETDAAEMVKQMLEAVNYLHCRNIIHRDIKMDNFLLEGVDSRSLKLIDFGVSKHTSPDKMMSTTCSTGTLAYTAPEVLDNLYNYKCDMWSLGVVTFILLVGYMPFYGDRLQMQRMIALGSPMNNGPKDRWNLISDAAKDFVNKLFKKSPVDRMSAEQALRHPWIVEGHKTRNNSLPLDFVAAGLQSFMQASQFRKACMLMMSWSIPVEEQAKIRNAFVELDKQGKGVVAISELMGYLNPATEQAMQTHQLFGKYGGEYLRYSDFLAAVACTRMIGRADLIQEAFRRFDVSNSGLLTENGLKKVLGSDFECGVVIARFPGSEITINDFMEYLESGYSEIISPTNASLTSVISPRASMRKCSAWDTSQHPSLLIGRSAMGMAHPDKDKQHCSSVQCAI
jgi:calcium-dependent protein kinase